MGADVGGAEGEGNDGSEEEWERLGREEEGEEWRDDMPLGEQIPPPSLAGPAIPRDLGCLGPQCYIPAEADAMDFVGSLLQGGTQFDADNNVMAR